jgi:hypothetical protein
MAKAKTKTTHYWSTASTRRCGGLTTAIEKRLASVDTNPNSIEEKLRLIKEEAGMAVYAMREDRLRI